MEDNKSNVQTESSYQQNINNMLGAQSDVQNAFSNDIIQEC